MRTCCLSHSRGWRVAHSRQHAAYSAWWSMDLPGNRSHVVAQTRGRISDQVHEFLIQWRPPKSLSAPTGDLQTGECPFLDQRSFELGDRHEHAKLKLTDGILLRGVNPLAGADQRHVSHLQFADDDNVRLCREKTPCSMRPRIILLHAHRHLCPPIPMTSCLRMYPAGYSANAQIPHGSQKCPQLWQSGLAFRLLAFTFGR